MSHIISYKSISPKIAEDVFIASPSVVIGDTKIESGASVWFNVTIRGDVNYIRIGKNSNIQDNAVVHVTDGGNPCIIGDNVTVGHSAVLHACTIGNNCLIGMGAIILDGAIIPDNTMVAAGSLVSPGKTFESGQLVVGNPAKPKRPLTQPELDEFIQSAKRYTELAKNYI